MLDLACGAGRHARYLADTGRHRVVGVDRDLSGVADLRDDARFEWFESDLENGPWPLGDRQFDAVVVTNYLWRPLFEGIVRSVAPGGLLIYETFAAGNESYGRPRNPDFLLSEGELLARVTPLLVIAFEQGVEDRGEGRMRVVQRIAATADSFPVDLASDCAMPPAES